MTLNHFYFILEHPITYICSQNTISHQAQKLIYHCVLTVFPAQTQIRLYEYIFINFVVLLRLESLYY